jgi:hypothetical protein
MIEFLKIFHSRNFNLLLFRFNFGGLFIRASALCFEMVYFVMDFFHYTFETFVFISKLSSFLCQCSLHLSIEFLFVDDFTSGHDSRDS